MFSDSLVAQSELHSLLLFLFLLNRLKPVLNVLPYSTFNLRYPSID